MTSPIGQTIANRRLEVSLGTGELGEVFRVTNLGTERTEALRLFPVGLSAAPGFADSYAVEAKALASLDDPHVVKVLEEGQENGRCFLAMEYMPNGSLRKLLQRGAGGVAELSIDQCIDLLCQAAEGLGYIHRQGRLHRNLKPESLLLARMTDGSDSYLLKIGDFGISHLIDTNSTPAAGMSLNVSSAIYASPEQLKGLPFGARSDIYVLGVVLYEALTGALPFTIRSFDEGYSKHLNEQPRPPRSVRSELTPELEAIILRCLAKRSEDRFQTAAELAAALRQVQKTNKEAAQAQPEIPPTIIPPTDASPLPRVQVADRRGTVIRTEPLTGDGLHVGRGSENDIGLNDPLIADQHVLIDWDGMQAQVMDLGSAKGTTLGGVQLVPQKPHPWPVTQLLHIGPYWMQLNPPRAKETNGASLPATAPAIPPPPTPPVDPLPTERGVVRHIIVSPEPKTLTITPGEPTQLAVQLINQGRRVDHFTMEIEGVPQKWWKGPEEPVQLNPSDRQSVVIQVNVPQEPASEAKPYPVRIRARSDNNTEFGEAAGQWTVLPFYRSSVWIPQRRRRGLLKGRYTIGVRNEGNAPSSFGISGKDEEEDGRVTYDAEPQQLIPEPGKTLRSVLSVRSRLHLYGRPIRREFTIAVTPKNEAEPKTQLAYFTQHPLIAWWLPWVLLALLLITAGIIYWLSIPKLTFRTDQQDTVLLNSTVTTHWEVEPAANLTLLINSRTVVITQVPDGGYSFRVRNTTPIAMSLEARTLYGYIVRTQVVSTLGVVTPTASPRPPTEPPPPTASPRPPTKPPPPPTPIPTNTFTAVPSTTPTASKTPTPTVTATPDTVLPCVNGSSTVVSGIDRDAREYPVPLLVYLVQTNSNRITSERAITGGTTDARGYFNIPIMIDNLRAGNYGLVVRERYTGKEVRRFSCPVPGTPVPTVPVAPTFLGTKTK